MLVYSTFNDDELTVMIHAESSKDAKEKIEKIIKETGLEIDLDGFFPDDISESEIEGVTVEKWLENKGIEFGIEKVLVIDFEDVQVYNL